MEFDVQHEANTESFTLPSYLEGVGDILEDEDALVKWAQDHEIIHGLLHYGLQEMIIKLRQVARPPVKMEFDKDLGKEVNIGKTINADKEDAQERINDFVIKPIKRPGTGGTKITKALNEQKAKMRTVLEGLGKSEDEINELLSQL